MTVLQDLAQGGSVTGFLDMLRYVELRQNVFVDGGFGADDLDVEVLPGHTQFATLETGREIALAGENNPTDLGQFITYRFDEPVVIDAEEPLWIEAEVEIATAQQTIGCDAPGSLVVGGDWLWSEDRWAPFSERTSERVNWNIRGIVE